ncbi:MAG: hypothetical protein SF052_12240 [Bacteroidia bacterium]|nr:hypothetical protein [Bacteroidia bacterium]
MLLTTYTSIEWLDVSTTALTVVNPGTQLVLEMNFTARQAITLMDIVWEIPDTLSVQPDPASEIFPYSMTPGELYLGSLNIRTFQTQEGFGEINAVLVVSIAGETVQIPIRFWLSVFERKSAQGAKALNDELRRRLIQVVNARARNGHIFLANFQAFFDDFLNIEIPPSLAKLVGEELGLADESLPVYPELYYEIILGKQTFYGIEKLELIAEEDCNESDDRFDPDDTREVAFINLDNI